MILRDYQIADIEALRANIRAGIKRQLLVEPTGAGKGTSITYILRESAARGLKSVFLVNRRTLVEDMSRRVDALDIDHGVIMGDHERKRPWLPCQIASIDTLHRRAVLPPADILILDEAHFAVSPIWLKVLARYPEAVVIGCTATPIRLDGQGLGHIFERMVTGPSVAELIARGYLAPMRVFAPPVRGLGAVKKSAGDYNQADLGAFMMGRHITGNAVEHWLKHGRGRPTVAFCVTIAHSLEVRDAFRKAGVRAEQVDNTTSTEDRDRMWTKLESGEVELVTSVGIISYGWDAPYVSCGLLLRPTQSTALHLQQCGRILRPYPGKDCALILDHAGNTREHGLVDELREWSLENGLVKKEKEKDEGSIRYCEGCFVGYPSTMSACPNCGLPYKPKTVKVAVVAGTLEEISAPVRLFICLECRHKGKLPQGTDYTQYCCPKCQVGAVKPIATIYDSGEDRRDVYLRLVREGVERNYKPGWAKVIFHTRFKTWPKREWDSHIQQEEFSNA